MEKFTERIKKILKREEYQLPYIPPLEDYTLVTKETTPIQEGDVVIIIHNYELPKFIRPGYIGIVLPICKDTPNDCYKVIFGSDFLRYTESKYIRTGVFFIKKTALIRCYLRPVCDFSESHKN